MTEEERQKREAEKNAIEKAWREVKLQIDRQTASARRTAVEIYLKAIIQLGILSILFSALSSAPVAAAFGWSLCVASACAAVMAMRARRQHRSRPFGTLENVQAYRDVICLGILTALLGFTSSAVFFADKHL